MSIKIPISHLSDIQIETINKDLLIRLPSTKGTTTKYICPFFATNESVYLPFSYSVKNHHFHRPKRETFKQINAIFTGTLRPLQQQVKDEALVCLNRFGSVLISLYTGGGKTRIALYISEKIKLTTLIIVNKIVLLNQWAKSIKEVFSSAKIQKLKVGVPVDNQAEFYIVNAINLPKFGHVFDHVGLVIVDETHLIMAEILSQSLQYIQPRYLIGLSATPYRPDGLNILLDLYYGSTNYIDRKLFKPHTAYIVRTGFSPPMEKTDQGRINWGAILDAQANNKERNELIVQLLCTISRNFLVLVKRVEQGNYLVKRLEEENQSVTSLFGSNQVFNPNARILVGTGQKIGTGFDHPSLDALLLAGDVMEYFIQVLGRVFRREDVVPLVFDLVDDNPILMKHFKNRRIVYEKHGGKIKVYNGKI